MPKLVLHDLRPARVASGVIELPALVVDLPEGVAEPPPEIQAGKPTRPRPEGPGTAGPRRTHDGPACFEAGQRPAPQHEDREGTLFDAGTYVRIRGAGEPLDHRSLGLVVSAGAEGVLLDGAVGRHGLERFGAALAVLEAEQGRAEGSLRMMPVVDTALSVLALPSLGPASRLVALACDPKALATALGCAEDAPAVVQARASAVLTAAACGVPAVLIVHSANAATRAVAAHEGFAAILAPNGRQPPPGGRRSAKRVSGVATK